MAVFGQMGIIHRCDKKIIEIRKFSLEKTAKRSGVALISHSAQDIAVNIVKHDGARLENIMRIDPSRDAAFDAVDFGESETIVHMVKHDPSGRREKKFDFGKCPVKQRVQIKRAQRLIMKDAEPNNDKHGNKNISDDSPLRWHHRS